MKDPATGRTDPAASIVIGNNKFEILEMGFKTERDLSEWESGKRFEVYSDKRGRLFFADTAGV